MDNNINNTNSDKKNSENPLPYYIFLDPHKYLFHVAGLNKYPQTASWTYIRTYDDCISLISKNGVPKAISLCHNFTSSHLFSEDLANFRGSYDYEGSDKKTGYHFIKWLTTFCRLTNSIFPDVFTHEKDAKCGNNNIRKLVNAYNSGWFKDEKQREELIDLIEKPTLTPPSSITQKINQKIIVPDFRKKENETAPVSIPVKKVINLTVFEA